MPTFPIRLIPIFLAALLLAAGPVRSSDGAADTITVFAAASLKNAMDEIAAGFEESTGHKVIVSFAGSSALARQIQHGAPADVFISANQAWMDLLEAQDHIVPATRIELLTNSLVLIAAGRDAKPMELAEGMDLAGRLGDSLLAMALVEAVPVGIYGKAALQRLGAWHSISARIAQTDNARSALRLVASGEASLGIVYSSDALAEDNVSVIGVFPPGSHPDIIYPAAATTAGKNEIGVKFLTFLQGEVARRVFEQQGFTVLSGQAL